MKNTIEATPSRANTANTVSGVMLKKIDIHCHTSNREITGVVPTSSTLEAISNQMHKFGVDKTVLLATYFPHKGTGISNYRLLNWIQNSRENGRDKKDS